MKRQDYILIHAKLLKKYMDRQQKLSNELLIETNTNRYDKKLASLNWESMNIEKTKERLAFALRKLTPQQAQKQYQTSKFHVYKGIEDELNETIFQN